MPYVFVTVLFPCHARGFGQSFVAACALAKGVVDPAPFRVTTAATASTAQFSRKASQTLGSLADPGLSRPASATPAASAAASEDVREPIATGEDEADTREGLSKPKRKKCPRKSAGISPGGGATGVQGDGSNSGGGAGGAGGGDGGGVSVVPASPKDTTKKSGGKKKKRGSSGKGSGGAVVADACSDAKGVGQGGIERSNKKSKKRRKAGANAGDSDAQAVAAVAAAEDAGSKDPEGEGRGSSGAGDARSSGVGDAKKKKVKRKKGQKK